MILPLGWSTARVHDYGISGVHLRHRCGWMSNQAISEYDSYSARRIMDGHVCRGHVTVVETTEYVNTYDVVDTYDSGVVEVVEEIVEYVTDDGGFDTGCYDDGGGFSSDW
jgi:hypothetical protein